MNDLLQGASDNETIEIMQFIIDGENFGVNVAEVREIMLSQKVEAVPQAGEYIEGCFKPRDVVITLFNLPLYIGKKESAAPDKDLFIVTNYDSVNLAFRVHAVEKIVNISAGDIQMPQKVAFGIKTPAVIGFCKIDDKIINIISIEKLIDLI